MKNFFSFSLTLLIIVIGGQKIYSQNVYYAVPAPEYREGREIRHELRDIQRDREELRRNYETAAALQRRIRTDYDYRDRRAARYDEDQLARVNIHINRLVQHIEQDERRLRHEAEERRERAERWRDGRY